MNKKIKNILKNTTIGTFTSPITIPGGFLILSVDEKRETKQKYDLDKEIKIIAQKKTNEQLNQFSILYRHISSNNSLIQSKMSYLN